MENKLPSLGVVGMFHLGCVYAASFAKMGYRVACFDYDKTVINNLKKGIFPIHEPYLNEYVSTYKKNLRFEMNIEDVIKNKQYIFITFDLPVNERDVVQLSLMNKVATSLEKYCTRDSVVVISSQVPLGTSRRIMERIERKLHFKPAVIYFPENLRLGNAFDVFLNPERIILGSDSMEVMDQFIRDFSFFQKTEVIKMSLESAEMLKHALNSYLAMCVSFSSEIGDLCELLGANANDVVKGLKSDKRVSKFAPLNPGLGFAGGTLGRDLRSLDKLSVEHGYKLKLLKSVYMVNQDRLSMLMNKIKKVYPSLKGKSVGVLGLTYKPNTNTLRRSMALGLVELLKKAGAHVKAYDPVIQNPITGYKYLVVCTTLDEFFKDLDALVLMTDWPEFRDLDFNKYLSLLRGKVIFDSKNFLDAEKIVQSGLAYKGIGI